MKRKKLKYLFLSLLIFFSLELSAKIIRIPEIYNTIQDGINAAQTGDTILIAPGTYFENIQLTKELTIASSFILTGDESAISETIIDGQAKSYVFSITQPKDGISSIIGLTIRNGEDGLMASAPINLINNFITACEDGIDYETGGGGLCKNNVFINNLDDGVDLDGTLYHIIVENNIIAENDDDGIEIRLHSYKGNPSYCRISNNKIYNNKEDGIQFIDYPDTTLRTYLVERNLIYNNAMGGIAFMDNGDTKEDYRGARIPEPIYVFNNTISGNNYGMTGGGGLIALNNLIVKSTEVGMFNANGNSEVVNNLFFENNIDTLNCFADTIHNLFKDPKLLADFIPDVSSPCIDRGLRLYVSGNDTLLNLSENDFNGTAPEIGATEYNGSSTYNNELLNEEKCLIFPNPFHDFFELRISDSKMRLEMHLLNSSGKIIETRILNHPVTRFNTSNLNSGIYFVSFSAPKNHPVQKIVKL